MSLTPKPFRELLGMKFIIPAYQRGYRWDNEQVETLLNDLYDFIKKHSGFGSNSSDYYCLQPMAVVPKPETTYDKENVGNESYIVVDGQQRLTTIYLLLHYLRQNSDYKYPIYELRFDSRDVQDRYIHNLLFLQGEGHPKEDVSNIDIFYLEKAYQTITDWFENDPQHAQRKGKFRELFTFTPLQDEAVNDVRVIWYVISHNNALEAFRRLNYGKIPLTSSELVKALLLQGDETGNLGRHGTGAPYRRALEWDEMEHTLHNPYLWSMLSDNVSDNTSRMEVILDFVADEFNMKMSDVNGKVPFVRKEKSLLGNIDARDYFNYNVVSEYLRRNGNAAIEEVWNRMRSIFNLITNWYENHEWYHLIGLMRILPSPKNRKSRRDYFKMLYSLAIDDNGRPVDRPVFTSSIKERIANEVSGLGEMLNQLNYNDNSIEIIKLLKLLNVWESINDPNEGSRFAFHLFDDYKVTSLEHIHPQNITTDASYDDYKEWVKRRSEDFEKLQYVDIERIAINRRNKKNRNAEDNVAIDENHSPITKEQVEDLKTGINNAIAILEDLTKTRKRYSDANNKAKLTEAAKTLDLAFGEFSGINEKELHSISNLCLVDKDTNSSLQNFFLDRKREILMKRHIPDRGKDRLTYAPPATRKVFAKDYSRLHPG
ncbi:MAG: DUF262 domain-containing protein, partial [Muribaculaceae bacterium]|nr:DUF262 domain-containing protein [Muribaculaceae bacterium]